MCVQPHLVEESFDVTREECAILKLCLDEVPLISCVEGNSAVGACRYLPERLL